MAEGDNVSLYRCPVHREPVRLVEGRSELVGIGHGEVYPIIDGIPVFLPDPAERQRVLTTYANQANGESRTSGDASPLDFYNQTRDHDRYCREELGEMRGEIEAWLPQVKTAGPTLEIGSGKGALQGTRVGGGRYVALDYSFTALRRYIDPKHVRVCGTAERLPFADATFALAFTVAALEHVPQADLAFDEIARVLKPGGVAFLAPAWHCVQYNCDGIPVRPYRDLTLMQKWTKATLPLRRHRLVKAAATLPGRVLRRAAWALGGRRPTHFRFRRLRPDYEVFWLSDSDACSRLDSHEACLFYRSRGYEVLAPGDSTSRQLLVGHVAIVVRKPL
jgi:SAM-dependent methyltransferase/uncharacterized protein YbaR (Trm112 family)